ncbi:MULTISPECIES: DUF3267 domain-containing protein [Bacillaceae]|uniref:Diaminopimelate epimerase n=1 Tax=Domibacillus aminovorans TaxID=29332 RepID=A0A177KIJ6_9BACI|nr:MULTISPECIES: DUF3267 domain-containing protein [Bacillaceae]OAH53230.1 hypothetical protein AWH48_12830 [Domibacillus aminovorans]
MNLPHEPDHTVTFNIKKIHIQALIITVASIVLGAVLMAFFHIKSGFEISFWNFFLLAILYTALIILHEVFHLIGFMIWGKCKRSDLVYGINRELGIAYAGTKKVIVNKAMKKALLLPFWMTGMLPFVIGIWLNNSVLMIVAAFLIGGAAGDFSMYNQLRKIKKDAFILDDVNEPKLYVYNKNPSVFN